MTNMKQFQYQTIFDLNFSYKRDVKRYSTYDILEDVIIIADVSGVIAKVRVETSSRGRVR